VQVAAKKKNTRFASAWGSGASKNPMAPNPRSDERKAALQGGQQGRASRIRNGGVQSLQEDDESQSTQGGRQFSVKLVGRPRTKGG